MTYEKTKAKPTDKDKQTMFELRGISTPKIIWFLVKRHKMGLVITWAIVMTSFVMVPTWPVMVYSLFN